MKFLLVFLFTILILSEAMANDKVTSALGEYAWEKRQIIVFSPNAKHRQYKLFTKFLTENKQDFDERKLQTWHVIKNNSVTLDLIEKNDADDQDFREAYNISENEFSLILIGYDQGEKLRQSKVDINYIFSKIDQMPMRLQEMGQN